MTGGGGLKQRGGGVTGGKRRRKIKEGQKAKKNGRMDSGHKAH